MTFTSDSIVFNTGEPACAIDHNGRILAWNEAAGAVFGYPESEALGSNCWELLQGRDVFGNLYCSERCPLQRMAANHSSVNRCRLNFKSPSRDSAGFIVSTLSLFDETGQGTLIHLFRPASDTLAEIAAAPDHPHEFVEQGVLTPRESEVLELLSAGHATRDIATLMKISVSTVRNHIEHILRKLHAHSRLEAVAVSRRLGLVHDVDSPEHASHG